MANEISRTDVRDVDFVDAIELASDGYYIYRIGSLTSTTNATKVVLTNPSDSLDVLINVDEPLQVADRVWIQGSSAADGYYIVNTILNDISFSVNEDIPDSTGGTIYYMHPAGALKVGFDSSNTINTSADNVQKAIEDLDAAIPEDGYVDIDAQCIGQVLYSVNGSNFQAALPITSSQGWLVNNQGLLIVGTCDDGYC
jgi:hypothetical protein